MESFFKVVPANISGEIIYKPVKLAVTEQGRIFLEVHQDIYDNKIRLLDEARRLIVKQQLTNKVDWSKIKAIVKKKSGTVEDISL